MVFILTCIPFSLCILLGLNKGDVTLDVLARIVGGGFLSMKLGARRLTYRKVVYKPNLKEGKKISRFSIFTLPIVNLTEYLLFTTEKEADAILTSISAERKHPLKSIKVFKNNSRVLSY